MGCGGSRSAEASSPPFVVSFLPPNGENIFDFAAAGNANGLKEEVERCAKANDQQTLNWVDGNGVTGLMQAAYHGHVECVGLLLKAKGVNVNAKARSGNTAMTFATTRPLADDALWERKQQCAALLKDAGATVPNPVAMVLPKGPGSDLCAAAAMGDVELLTKAVADCAGDASELNLQHPAMGGSTPVIICCEKNALPCLKLLLATKGVDSLRLNTGGESAVMRAAMRGHSECLLELLAVPGVDVNVANISGGITALHLAVMLDKIDCVRLLCSAPRIDLGKKMTGDKKGSTGTALSLADTLGKKEIATLLRLSGAKE